MNPAAAELACLKPSQVATITFLSFCPYNSARKIFLLRLQKNEGNAKKIFWNEKQKRKTETVQQLSFFLPRVKQIDILVPIKKNSIKLTTGQASFKDIQGEGPSNPGCGLKAFSKSYRRFALECTPRALAPGSSPPPRGAQPQNCKGSSGFLPKLEGAPPSPGQASQHLFF